MYVALKRPQLCTIREMATAYGISRNHLIKVVHRLAQAGFLRTLRGKGGGVTLGRNPKDISIGEVVRYTEGPLRVAECFRGPDNHCVISTSCELARVLKEACDNFLATLDRYTLEDLLVRHAALRKALNMAVNKSCSERLS